MVGFSDLTDYWAETKWDLESRGPLVHSRDEGILRHDHVAVKDFDTYRYEKGVDLSPDGLLHLGLVPVPYLGDLASASVVLLMANPRFDLSDYHAEGSVPRFRQAMLDNLYQRRASDEFPFVGLDPEFAWHTGFGYWADRLGSVVGLIRQKRNDTYEEALRFVAQRVAVVQLSPYHSRTFRLPRGVMSELESMGMARDAITTELDLPGNRLFVVARKRNEWGMRERSDTSRLKLYRGAESRSGRVPGRLVESIVTTILTRA